MKSSRFKSEEGCDFAEPAPSDGNASPIAGQCITDHAGEKANDAVSLVGNFHFHQLREQDQRFLPAEITGLGGNHVGDSFLHHV